MLLSHHFHDDSFITLPIEFGIENALPGTQIQLASRDWNDDFMMDQQRFQVRIAIILAGFVMLVSLAKGREVFEPLVDVLDQAAFVIVDVNPPR